MLSRGAVESLPEFLWRIVVKLPEFNLFADKSAGIFLNFPSICPNFHGFPKNLGGGQLPPACPPVSYAYVEIGQHIVTKYYNENRVSELPILPNGQVSLQRSPLCPIFIE
jgi:hypothetical protein